MLPHRIANAKAAELLRIENEKNIKLDRLHGLLFRFYKGDIKEIARAAERSVSTMRLKFSGGRSWILRRKGELSPEEEAEMNKLLEELPNLKLISFPNKPLFERYKIIE